MTQYLNVLRSWLMAVRDWYNWYVTGDHAKHSQPAAVSDLNRLCRSGRSDAATLKSLGFTVDQRLSFNDHATVVAKLHTWIRVHTPVCSLINNRLDYCNSLLYGVAEATINKL